jgi:multiple sugar transport system permease protein
MVDAGAELPADRTVRAASGFRVRAGTGQLSPTSHPGAARGGSGRPALTGVLLTAPALLLVAAAIVFPIGWTIVISLNGADYALTGAWDFVWLDNYLRIAASSDFLAALAQTLGFVAVGLLCEALIAVSVALALHRGVKGSRVFRAIVALPLMVAPVVGALAWRFVFGDGYGMIDSAAAWLGGDGPLWFADIWLARTAILIAGLWLALPFDILLLLAGLASLPAEPMEAARVDGASRLQTLRMVVLPLLKPVILIIVVVRLADAFRVFDVVYVLTASGPANATDVLSTYIYRQMFNGFDFAGGTAASIMLVALTALASLAAVAVLRERWRTA